MMETTFVRPACSDYLSHSENKVGARNIYG